MKRLKRSGFGISAGIIILLSFFINSQAQQLAFPGAEGGGRFAVGGRGGSVYEVTNLNDSGPGSLRDGISVANRTIVFRVSGIIRLNSTLRFTKDNITVAGQTAPGDGICISGYTISVQASNIIIRHIRSRLTDATLIEDDAMHSFSGNYQNIIIDHCSLSWSVDETGTFYDIKNFTLQWCILSESLYHSVHDKGDHGYAGIWGGNNASFHHNLLAHHTSRNPRFGGSRYTGKPDEELVDFRNNVLYNWGNINSAYGGEGGNYNMVNNYYKPGPATPGNLNTSSASNKRNRILNYTSYYYASDAAVFPDTLFGGKFYIDGNFVKGYPDVTSDNWTNGVQKDSYKRAAQLISAARQNAPFATAPVSTQTAEAAYVSVLNGVGATLPVRDVVDKRIINETKTGTATFEGATYATINATGISHPSGIIDTQGDVGGLPVYNSTAAPSDSDHDGMPDAWEVTNSLNPNDANDGNIIASGGYTNLENYLNSLTVVQPSINVIGSVSSFSQLTGSPSSVQTYSVYGTALSNDILITPPEGFEISSDGGTTWNTHSSPLTLTQVNGVISETVLRIRLNAAITGSYSGNIIHSSTGASQLDLPITGIVISAITAPAGTSVTVAKDGSGNYTTVQAAIDAAPTGRSAPYIIFIKSGIYKEKITVPSNKPFLQLVGERVSTTILTYDDYSGKAMPGGGTYGTSNSASVTINAADFSAINVTFENTTGDAPQALAINVNADRAAFNNCRFLGGQDTVLANGSGNKQYFRHCYIDGVVDFIFGNSRAVFDSCFVYAKSRVDGLNGSYITAANTQSNQSYGYVFRNCVFPSNTGVTKYVLGRPWQNSTGSVPLSFPRVVLLNTTMGFNQIKPEGWAIWDAGTVTSSIYYAEYKSRKFNGDPVNISSRVNWSFQLSDPEAAVYTNATLFGSWDPCAFATGFCDNTLSSVAVSNFKGKKGATTSSLTWNISWPMKNIKYELFRSSDKVSFSKINEQVSLSDTTVNFNYTDAVPSAGSTFYYFIIASKAGRDPHKTELVEISSTPTITTTGALNNFSQGLGLPSAIQAYTISGANLTNDVTITPPIGYEISLNGTSWTGNANPLVLTQSGSSIPTTTISVRLNSPTTGSFPGKISHRSAGATTVDVNVTGDVQTDPLAVAKTIQYWPLTVNALDDDPSRDLGLLTTQPTFKKLSLSNGTTVVSIPAYSTGSGQAFGAGTIGDGLWSAANGGPGGNLNRGIYQQFTVKAASNYSVHVDSILLKSSFYNTSSNTKLAIVYSRSGFTTADSTSISGGVGPDGMPLLSTANGAFATPVLLTNETAGTTKQYRFAFAGSAGVDIPPGGTLTIRLYFSCGSTSTGRYGKLKDVYIKGSSSLVPVVNTIGTLSAFTQIVGTPSATKTYSVSGSNLRGPITITPPANFEISSNGGTTWNKTSSPLVLSPVSGSVASTPILVRLNASVKGSYTGNITHATIGLGNVNVSVSGASADPVTGLEENASLNITLSPNPAKESVTIYHPVSSQSNGLVILTSTGIRVMTSATGTNESSTVIDVSSLSAGFYIMELKIDEKNIVRRFIKL
ncbi:MAG: T9SS type A sorting domain-containing protein [Cyclobacteriaceae bacterium]|nr:T9SS type A sorting domain-containing protein [Cyclobacteriaceae bacterium]